MPQSALCIHLRYAGICARIRVRGELEGIMSPLAARRPSRTALVLIQLLVFVTYIFGPTASMAQDPSPEPAPTESAAPESTPDPTCLLYTSPSPRDRG